MVRLNTRSRIENWIALLFLIAGAAVALPGAAQMYTWKDPETGQTEMSNVAPPWYQANQPAVRGAPRTQVLLNGSVIDDTGVRASPDHRTNVNTQLDIAARQQAEEATSQQIRAAQAQQQAAEAQRQSSIAQLRRQRMDLMAKISGGPLVAGRGPFDVTSVTTAVNQLAEVNRQLNALDPQGAQARAEEQKRGLGAVAKFRQQELDKQRDRDAVRGAVKDAIRDCVRGAIDCRY